jgi:hypothetical protein
MSREKIHRKKNPRDSENEKTERRSENAAPHPVQARKLFKQKRDNYQFLILLWNLMLAGLLLLSMRGCTSQPRRDAARSSRDKTEAALVVYHSLKSFVVLPLAPARFFFASVA